MAILKIEGGVEVEYSIPPLIRTPLLHVLPINSVLITEVSFGEREHLHTVVPL